VRNNQHISCRLFCIFEVPVLPEEETPKGALLTLKENRRPRFRFQHLHQSIMPTSLPSPTDLPSSLRPIIHLTSAPLSSISNIAIFLSGLGDTSANFSSFPLALNLPSTLTITLQAPIPIPLPEAGTHWADDLILDTQSGTIDPDGPSFNTSTKLLAEDVIKSILITKHGFKPREILLLGSGQGASIALAVALRLNLELGGVVAIGGLLPLSSSPINASKNRTPILLLGGSKGVLTRDSGSGAERTKDAFEVVEMHQWKKGDDSMPKNREEAMPMMGFFARRLRSRQGVVEGAVEIG
jgi:predicted esterase